MSDAPAPGPPGAKGQPAGSLEQLLKAKTSEGAQELLAREGSTVRQLRQEAGGVLRRPEGTATATDWWGEAGREPPRDETMVLNLGPVHPSTHGVLRVMAEIRGEQVLRTKPVIGYLHTGMEKTGEGLGYHQGFTNVTRMDYLSPFFEELAFSLSVERLAGITVPERATWIRMLMCELNRVASHLLWLGTNGADLGGLNLMVYGWRDREVALAFFEKVTGLRMNHNYIRPGGVAVDLPDGWRDDLAAICDTVERRMDEYDDLLAGQPVFQGRLEGVGPLDAATAVALGLTGPLLRSTGVAYDVRRDFPYLAYDQVDFDVVVGTAGDCWDRFAIRMAEIRESARILRQVAKAMPGGDFRAQEKKMTPPPRNRLNESMEGLICHFKLFTEGFRVAPGDAYVPVESPRGELGCYMVSDGTSRPYRMHVRAPSFANLQGLAPMARRAFVADVMAIVSSIDPVMGDADR
jgi:NADH-quinone oxidoreductase subunit D